MSAETFPKALKLVLRHEGGKVDDPHDPGGRTNQGVTQGVYDGYRRRIGKKPQDVYKMANAERDAIYRRQYWAVCRADELPKGVDYVVFDGAVNSGPIQSVKWLQRALKSFGYRGPLDGHIGEETLRAAMECNNHDELVDKICDQRLAFLKKLKGWKRYKGGWQTRVMDVRTAGFAMATGLTIKPSNFSAPHSETHVRAEIKDAVDPADESIADATTGVGTATTVIAQTTDSLMPLSYASENITRIIVILTVLGIALTIGGIVWKLRSRSKNRDRTDNLDLSTAQ